VEHEATGALKIPGIPIKLSKSPGRVERPAPNLSQHTVEVLKGLLEMNETEIEELKQDEVI
jgi:CoA:oxalate CoA-transferase